MKLTDTLKILRILIADALLFCSICAGPLFAVSSGQTTAEFLKIVPDPKSVGIGEGGSALAASAGMAAINPAGLASLYQPMLSVGYVPMVEDIKYSYAGFGVPSAWGTFGGSVMYLDYGDIKGVEGDTLREFTISGSKDMAFTLSYAVPIRRTVPVVKEYAQVGFNVKLIHSELAEFAAEAIAIDAGAIYHLPYVKGLNLGLVGKNIGTKMKFNKEGNDLPQSVVAGLGYRNSAFRELEVNADYEMPSVGPKTISAGISITPMYFVTLRAGWKMTEDSLDSGLRAGIGLNMGDFSIQYAMVPFKEYSTLHRVGVEIAVGGIVKPEMASDHYLKLHMQQVKGYYYQRDFISAKSELEEIVAVYPEYEPAKEYLEKVNQDITSVETEREGRVKKYLKRADISLSRRNLLEAKKYYDYVLKVNSMNDEARTGIEKVNEALKTEKLEEMRRVNRAKIEKLWSLSMESYRKGDYVKSKEKLNEVLAIDTGHEEAKKYVIEIDNQLAKVTAAQVNDLYEKGLELYKSENYEKALKYFEAVVIAAPHRMDAQDFVTKCQQAMQESEERSKEEKLAREQGAMKTEIEDAYSKALKLYERGDYVQALEWFEKTGVIASKYEFKQYIEDTTRYVSLIKFSLSEQYYKSGYELFQKNKFEDSVLEYRKALQYNPENVSAKVELERLSENLSQRYYELGMNYYTRGDTEKAKDTFKKSLSYKSNKEESIRALERIR